VTRRVLHHRAADGYATCSTASTRIKYPLVALKAYVTCPACIARLGLKASKPRAAKSKIAGLTTRTTPAMKDAMRALGVDAKAGVRVASPRAVKVVEQLPGQVDIFDDALLGADGQGDAYAR
jgi:hypothetical protein